ncbi:MAG: hypothetical protein QN198_12440 [Armatimonadota bacterium]|nr:hypothetical protein [Armatimonadota bacterium]MDR5704389.1 hypothetical protein [Armatimonadota bacterium]MDR7435720.1 hypothetical protein [Armatimonadota bacterium]
MFQENKLDKVLKATRDFLWGLFVFDFYKEVQRAKSRYEDTLKLLILGEMLGLPLMNSLVTLRLLPYLLPDLEAWKRRQLREMEVLEEAPEIH